MEKQVIVNIDNLKNIVCPDCQGENFEVIYQLKKIPALLSPNAKETLLSVPVYRCIACKQILLNPLENEKEAKNRSLPGN
jgi:uncharacterized Zn finger protein